ncbi:phosphoribosylformylglycinamidine synthase subunit PurQ [Pontivivens nitratireducens]|uniref:Phosphoribosylformylglycinamidine synthase subunit PurQ n=1 Tax=Pontivivens nitratireducens TaxID=2758038 RepID=A0A6G7VMG6_9RHOB|nr:phosphoribosylformylglycinamidine synthase subunit PurQ [Pontibrevibacter nitratireducens]QIK41122.1 phosphoribosylformylglycinamidine synthase subunit PurQ [Pontibrevibacter nitratireducens]
MKAAVITFPGSNCDRDMHVALQQATGQAPLGVWHKDTTLPDGLDLVVVPGGFSFGDYLRCGAIAARAPVMNAVVDFALRGGLVLGVCNGFQILIEAGLLPGALMRNSGLKYICKPQALRVATHDSAFTAALGETATYTIAHHDGNFIADAQTLDRLTGEDRVAFTYEGNPNGSLNDIAGILSENRRVLGMMPHPERLNDPALGGTDGAAFFAGLVSSLETA